LISASLGHVSTDDLERIPELLKAELEPEAKESEGSESVE
jgi:hypothetical protein